MDPSYDLDSFTCGQCHSWFSSIVLFILHKTSHVGPEAAISCIMCDEVFTEQKNYTNHLQYTHSITIEADSCVKNAAAELKCHQHEGSFNVSYSSTQSPAQMFVPDNLGSDHSKASTLPVSFFREKISQTPAIYKDSSVSTSANGPDFDTVATNIFLAGGGGCKDSVEKAEPVTCSENEQSYKDNSHVFPNGKEKMLIEVLCVDKSAIFDPVLTKSINITQVSDKGMGDIKSTLYSMANSMKEQIIDNCDVRKIPKTEERDNIVHALMKSNDSEAVIALPATHSTNATLHSSLQISDSIIFSHPSTKLLQSSPLKAKKPCHKQGDEDEGYRSSNNMVSSKQTGKCFAGLYTHMRSLLSSPLLIDRLHENEKHHPQVAPNPGDLHSSAMEQPDVLCATPDVQYDLSASALSSRQSSSTDLSVQSNGDRTANLPSESSALLRPSTAFLLPVSPDTLSLSHMSIPLARSGQEPSEASSVSLLSVPIVRSDHKSTEQHCTKEINQLSSEREENRMNNTKDSSISHKEVKTDHIFDCHTASTNLSVKVNPLTSEVSAVDTRDNVEGRKSSASVTRGPVVVEEDAGSVDFYFLLGTMNIQGNSLTYDRIDFRCLHCTFSTAWRPSLVKHMKNLHGDTMEIHKILDIRNCESSSELEQQKCKRLQVMKMSDYLAGNQKLKKRVRKLERQDIPGKYHCSTCMKVFNRLRYLRRHQTTHRTERTHLCDNCGKSFKTKSILVAHRRSHKTKVYHCPQCNFVSCSSAAIHVHRQLHPNGSVICDICGTAYIDKSTLNKHRKVHDLSRPFPCSHPGCTWRFKTDVMRKAHVRSHTTVGKFKCSYCGYNFRQKHHLHRHIAKIHSGQQAKDGIPSPAILSSSQTLPISSVTTATAQVFPDHESLTTASEHDSVKPIINPHTTLAITDSEAPVMSSSSTNHLLDPISDTPYSSTLADQELAMIEVLIGDKEEHASSLEEEERTSNNGVPSNGLSSLEYLTENGEVVQLVRPGQTYMGRDQYGNLVQYKIADVHDQDDTSHPIYFIGVDGTVVGATNSQEQALVVNSVV